MQSKKPTLVSAANGRRRLRVEEAGRIVEFEASDSARHLFVATRVEMFVDGRLVDEQLSWSGSFRLGAPKTSAVEESRVEYLFDYSSANCFVLRWRRFEDGEFDKAGSLPISNAVTSSASLAATFVWAVLWFGWLLPALLG